MNYRWLQSFIAVAQEGGVTKAAKTLFISPQALLQQINLLEETVNLKLFSRSTTGFKLTLAGMEFYKGAQQIIDIYSETLTRCHHIYNSQNTIRIPVMSTIVIPEFIESVCASYRETETTCFSIDLIQTSSSTSSWIDGLINREYDIIEYYTLDGFHPDGIYFEKIFDVETWCLMKDTHPLAGCTSIHPKDLSGFRISAPDVRLLRYLQIFLENTGIQVDIEEIPSDRYKIISTCNEGRICFLNKNIATLFPGFKYAPLAFDSHVQSGLACREDMAGAYHAFFAAAKKTCK